MKLIKEISVFFPAFNEEKNIKKIIITAYSILSKISKKFEIIIIDDGSKDNTNKIIKSLCLKYKNLKLITHLLNKGYGASLISGFYNSNYEWVAFADSDGQFDFLEIEKFISAQKRKDIDLVIGYYLKRQVSLFRKFNTFLWQFIVRVLFNLKVRDIDCGFKLINRDVIYKIPKLKSQRGAFISTELLVKSKVAGFKIYEIPVHHYPRKGGNPTGANFNVIVSSFKDLFKLYFELKSSK